MEGVSFRRRGRCHKRKLGVSMTAGMTRGAVARCLRTVVLVIAADMGRSGQERGHVGREIVLDGRHNGYVRRLVPPRKWSRLGSYPKTRREPEIQTKELLEVLACLLGTGGS